jgi:hypothetical protein
MREQVVGFLNLVELEAMRDERAKINPAGADYAPSSDACARALPDITLQNVNVRFGRWSWLSREAAVGPIVGIGRSWSSIFPASTKTAAFIVARFVARGTSRRAATVSRGEVCCG